MCQSLSDMRHNRGKCRAMCSKGSVHMVHADSPGSIRDHYRRQSNSSSWVGVQQDALSTSQLAPALITQQHGG